MKKNKYFNIALFALFLFFNSTQVFAENIISEKEVLNSSIEHFPKIISAIESYKAAEGSLKSSIGAFDLQMNQDLSSRAGGFYDGKALDSKLEKNIPDFNSKIYAGYRVSDGSFPIYEDKLITNNNGEFNVGLALSLLRGNFIDKKRLNLNNSRLSVEEKKLEILLTKIFVQHKALKTYYKWLSSQKKYDVYKELFEIAKKRQEALEIKVKSGDVANIYLTENKQYILQRQILLNEALRDLKVKSNDLSLYYRDKASKPIEIDLGYKSEFGKITSDSLSEIQKNIEIIKSKRPDLNIIETNLQKISNKIDFSKNLILPKVDLKAETSQDNGSGSYTRDELESVIKLSVSIPIQQNFAQGKIEEAEAQKRKYESDRKLVSEQIEIEIKNIIASLEAGFKYFNLTNQEVELAIKMQEAENEKFEKGNSDFLLLNIREEKMASAKLNNIESKLQYYSLLSDLYAASVDTEKLGIVDKLN